MSKRESTWNGGYRMQFTPKGADLTEAQRIALRRNWANGVVVGNMKGSLRYLKRKWPGLDTQRLEWALAQLEIDIDEIWYKQRDALRLVQCYDALYGDGRDVADEERKQA